MKKKIKKVKVKLNITQVTYGRTKNLGDYNSERLTLSAAVGKNESADSVLNRLKAEVISRLEIKSRDYVGQEDFDEHYYGEDQDLPNF